jgi:hypothetical protein
MTIILFGVSISAYIIKISVDLAFVNALELAMHFSIKIGAITESVLEAVGESYIKLVCYINKLEQGCHSKFLGYLVLIGDSSPKIFMI